MLQRGHRSKFPRRPLVARSACRLGHVRSVQTPSGMLSIPYLPSAVLLTYLAYQVLINLLTNAVSPLVESRHLTVADRADKIHPRKTSESDRGDVGCHVGTSGRPLEWYQVCRPQDDTSRHSRQPRMGHGSKIVPVGQSFRYWLRTYTP